MNYVTARLARTTVSDFDVLSRLTGLAREEEEIVKRCFVSFLGHAHAVTWLPIATKPSFLPSVVDVFVESSNVISVVASGKVLSDRARSSVATRFN